MGKSGSNGILSMNLEHNIKVPLELWLQGTFNISIDQKLRLQLPAKIRPSLHQILEYEQACKEGTVNEYMMKLKLMKNAPKSESEIPLPASDKETESEGDDESANIRLWVAPSQNDKIGIYPAFAYEAYLTNYDNLPPLESATQALNTYQDGMTFAMWMDRQYRIRLPQELCERMNYKKGQAVTVIGRRTFLEVWDRNDWAKFCDENKVTNLLNNANKPRS